MQKPTWYLAPIHIAHSSEKVAQLVHAAIGEDACTDSLGRALTYRQIADRTNDPDIREICESAVDRIEQLSA